MRISFQDKPVFPDNTGKKPPQLYRYYDQSGEAGSSVHWFDFHTREAHSLNVTYPGSFYKMVLCLEGHSQSMPTRAQPYAFHAGQMLFYQTEEGAYTAALPADTRFKIIHMHLSEAHTALLQNEVPALFDKSVTTMRLSPACAGAFLQLKQLSVEAPGLLKLFEEKLITDQLFEMAAGLLPRFGGKDILQEAIWHIQQADRFLTIAELSRLSGTNTFRLKQLFRDKLGPSVFRYQADLRLDHAAQMLLDSDRAISELSVACGYESPAAFSNAFLKKHGVRPQTYKNSRSRK